MLFRSPAAGADAEDPKKALIAAALARAKAQRAAAVPKNAEIDTLSPEKQAEIAAIEARRKRLGADQDPR